MKHNDHQDWVELAKKEFCLVLTIMSLAIMFTVAVGMH